MAYLGVSTPNVPRDKAALDGFTARHYVPSRVNFYRDFGDQLLYPDEARVLAENALPAMITLEPHDVRLAEISGGEHDDYLKGEARRLAAFNGSVILRFAHEMNGVWYPWCGHPEEYQRAYRRVVNALRPIAPHLRFVWCPNEDDAHIMPFEPYYPGRETVDFLGLDAYERWGTKSPHETFADGRVRLRRLGPQPIIICETGTLRTEKSPWLEAARRLTLREVLYFDFDRWAL